MGDMLRKWMGSINSPTDIRSKPSGGCGLKCHNCGNDDSNEFMKPMGLPNPVCLRCNKSVSLN